MTVKINDKQANRMTEDKTSDPTFDENKFLTNCVTVAFDEFFADEIFLLYSTVTVVCRGEERSDGLCVVSFHGQWLQRQARGIWCPVTSRETFCEQRIEPGHIGYRTPRWATFQPRKCHSLPTAVCLRHRAGLVLPCHWLAVST